MTARESSAALARLGTMPFRLRAQVILGLAEDAIIPAMPGERRTHVFVWDHVRRARRSRDCVEALLRIATIPVENDIGKAHSRRYTVMLYRHEAELKEALSMARQKREAA